MQKQVFVFDIPKEELSGTSPARLSFGIKLNIEMYPVVFTDDIL